MIPTHDSYMMWLYMIGKMVKTVSSYGLGYFWMGVVLDQNLCMIPDNVKPALVRTNLHHKKI